MKTVKHKIKQLTPEQEKEFLALVRAYQFEKNYWSDQLLDGSTDEINLKNLYTYQQIRNSKNLTKNNYQSKHHLPIRYCTIALKEAYELHMRTYEAQIALVKKEVNNKIYKFKPINEVNEIKSISTNSLATPLLTEDGSVAVSTPPNETTLLLKTFKQFLYFATNSLFYNYKTFRKFEEEFYSKKFKKARIYQRILPILQELFKKAIVKEVFTQYQQSLDDHITPNETNTDELHKQLQENIKTIEQFVFSEFYEFYESLQSTQLAQLLEQTLYYYCNCLVKVIVQFRNFKPIQSQINPTITLDGGCYKLYSKYDEVAKKNRWFLDIMSMEVGKRIKGLELTGFHHAKKIMKRKKYANLVLSFDPNQIKDGDGFYAHFVFDSKPIKKTGSIAKKVNKPKKRKTSEANATSEAVKTDVSKNKPQLATLLTIGGDFGLTESFTFSDGWVSGRKQGKVLSYIANSTKDSVAFLQKRSEKGFFGVEKNNKTGKRNHKNNCFNHNQLLGNINESYRKKQQKHNCFLQNYKYLLVNEIIEHFTSDSVYGQYTNVNHDNPIQLVFESLDYTSLGFDANQKRQINLIKGILNVLEEKIEKYNLPIKIIYVNPGYTSQACPNCCFVAKKNRDFKAGRFRCQHCSFTANDDERYKGLTEVVQRAEATLPSEDDFIASRNIAMRPFTIPDSMKLRVRDVKYRLMQQHESVKVSCKMFT